MTTELRPRIRDGDEDAFAELFDAYARSVYNHAFRLTGDWGAAEDAVSLTFLEAWRLRGRLDVEGGSLRPWLLGIATNVVRNSRRAARRHAAALSRLPRPEVVRDFADEVAGRIDDAASLAAVRLAVATLRRPEREVLALCVWSGHDYATAAEVLGIPVGTVRSRLSRARRKLAATAEARGAAPPAADGAEPPPRRGQVRDGRRAAAWPGQRKDTP
ncbi:sigma-70 family RNA polymerase sigma factor [Streptomyces sp. 3MP-14]|uniref:Sigma-70 family RNA polymerase sigma factor n=1 Tax=Streptomyces mimosae TaxID=2586635 RepID=A0A5N6ATJ7_9ACTN|nr:MULTISPECIES: RNA polymerase sigma factor [Streptomyces]KAB8171038.1 sigma-70 family RNA polymerase sigma factor [Streptomyces mimosae]KAB8179611.1 sigma-70 family RNA polymerase sigma factor [Streptomyces sp. 3MP-14]